MAERLLPSVVSLRHGQGNGSAVVLSSGGLLVTSAHVVARSVAGTAVFHDEAELPFEVVGRDHLSDLAVVRVPVDGLAAATNGDAGRLRVGQLVVAVGSPLGPEAERRGRFVQPTRGHLAAEHHPYSSGSRRHRVA